MDALVTCILWIRKRKPREVPKRACGHTAEVAEQRSEPASLAADSALRLWPIPPLKAASEGHVHGAAPVEMPWGTGRSALPMAAWRSGQGLALWPKCPVNLGCSTHEP